MPIIDTDSLLAAISDSDPTGPNLEYDPAFAALERAVQGKPEQQIGDAIAPGEPPDWNVVQEQALALLGRSKDLRVACHLVRALLNKHAFEGLGEGLAYLAALLERYWPTLHPQLDPEDNNDPAIRINTLAALCDASSLAAVRSVPLLRSRAFGPITLRDIAVASGEAQPAADAPVVETSTIEGAMLDADQGALESTLQALRKATNNIRAVDTIFETNAAGQGPDLVALVRLLQQAAKPLEQHFERARAAGDGAGGDASAPGAAGGQRLSGQINSREDVLLAIDKICSYYERHEPSSPLPLLLQRCKRLASKNFIDIVRDMVPDGVAQIEIIAGKREE
jgi:type VI secretion system protein ImpA